MLPSSTLSQMFQFSSIQIQVGGSLEFPIHDFVIRQSFDVFYKGHGLSYHEHLRTRFTVLSMLEQFYLPRMEEALKRNFQVFCIWNN